MQGLAVLQHRNQEVAATREASREVERRSHDLSEAISGAHPTEGRAGLHRLLLISCCWPCEFLCSISYSERNLVLPQS